MSKKKHTSTLGKPSFLELYDFIPLLIALAVVPLLIRITPVSYNTESIFWHAHLDTFYDFFSYFKSQVIVFLGALSLIPLVRLFLTNRDGFLKDKIVWITGAAMVLVILSSILAKSPYVAYKGYVERYEGVFVILSYWLFFLLAYKLTWTDRKIKWLFGAFWVSNIGLSLLGIGQYFGYDLLLTDWFTSLVTAFSMQGMSFDTEFIVNYKVIGQTLYHYNYVAFFITLSLPVFLTKFLYEKNWLYKGLYFITSGLILFNLLGSTARGGLLGVLVALVFWVVFNWRILFKNLKLTLVIAALLVVAFVGFETVSDGFVTRRILSTFETPRTEYALKSLYTENGGIHLETKDGTLSIGLNSEDLSQFDLNMTFNNKPIDFKEITPQNQGVFDLPILKDLLIYPAVDENGTYYLALEIKKELSLFVYQEGEFLYRYSNGERIDMPKAPAIGFDGLEKLGSGRGYIWSRTLPLVLEKPILGYGVDNYAIAFPQHDFIGKLNTYNTFNMFVDKAHNIYLQYAVSSGIPYLILYLALIAIVLIKGLIYIFKGKDQNHRDLVIALLTAIIGFHIAGYFNDSSVHVAPVFWVMLGTILGVMRG
ncbi:O-antigen ligase family protein [Fusibacter tunisiensis]|uniref:O-antigen ligase n=1 Tax=Fusibacter tunisiensis TaxID=1008308 RepID=A0ABS2MNE5_9FIRM|nr:O-antigen ligase family protein [Fusibacter tunisiensis]MBM7560913.1 O-antigen ligase [Fusibacter tunisiensis]